MELRWTENAAADLERISNYLFEQTPERALDLVQRIYDAPAELLNFPHRGRPGKKRERASLSYPLCPTLSCTESPAGPYRYFVFCMALSNGPKRGRFWARGAQASKSPGRRRRGTETSIRIAGKSNAAGRPRQKWRWDDPQPSRQIQR